MMIEEALYSKLTGTATLTAIVGSRIYSGIIPQGTAMPCLVFNPISTQKAHGMEITGKQGLYMATFQFDIVTTTAKQAAQIQEVLVDTLEGFRGSVSGFNIQKILLADVRSGYEADLEGHRRILDFDVDYCL